MCLDDIGDYLISGYCEYCLPSRMGMLHVFYITILTAFRMMVPSLAQTQDPLEIVCSTETFDATCNADEIVVMDVALYGRMRLSRCVLVDFGFIGCYADVLGVTDMRCSGKHECEIRIPDAEFDASQDCMGDLVRYFEASYHCQPVVQATREQCQTSYSIRAPGTSGVLASITTQETGCGARYRPWVIEVAPSQRINLTLYDFSVHDTTISSMLPCPEYLTVREDATGEATRICGGDQRMKHVYTSKTNKLQLEMTLAQTNPTVSFAIQYDAIGCTEPELPAGTTVRNYGDHVIVGCGSSSSTWRLDCRGSTWQGTIGNCSAPTMAHSTEFGNVITGFVSAIPNGYAIAIIIAIAIVISATILIFGLVYMNRKHSLSGNRGNAAAARPSGIHDKDVYYAKCNMELEGTLRRQGIHRQQSRETPRHPSSTTPVHVMARGSIKNDANFNDYGYESGSHWSQRRDTIPSYSGSDRGGPVEHIYESPVFSRRHDPELEDSAYFELDPDQVRHGSNIHAIHSPGLESGTDYWK